LKRKNILIIAGAVVIALAAGYPASSWYLGKRIEAAHKQIDTQIPTLPFVRLVSHEYERGIFSARETVVLEIFDTPAEDAADSTTPFRITLKNAIRHGPFLNGAFAMGSVDGSVEFSDEIQKYVLEASGGKPAMEFHAVSSLTGNGQFSLSNPAFSLVMAVAFPGGSGQFKLSSPAFQLSLPGKTEDEKSTLSGDGLELSGEVGRGLARYSIHGGLPRLEMTTPKGRRMTLTRLMIDFEQERMFSGELIFTGPQKFSLAGLEIDPGPGSDDDDDDDDGLPKFALTAFEGDFQTQASGEFVDMRGKIGAGGLRVGEQEHGPAAFDYSLNHLHARSLGTLISKFAVLLDKNKRLKETLESMKSDFISLLTQDAILSIDRIAFRLPDGDVNFNIRFRLDDGKPEDFNSMLRLIGKIDTSAELSLPEKSIDMLLSNPGKGDDFATAAGEILDRLVQQDYVTNDNGILHTRVVFRNGQLQLNDKPFNPMTLLNQ
jgi:uncharacterized protein YdgA (DUF945 family)